MVVRPEFDSLTESDQDFKKLVFGASLLDVQQCKMINVKISWQVHLLCPWTRHLIGLPLPLSG